MPRPLDFRRVWRTAVCLGLPFVVVGGCFKTLDESLLDAKDASSDGGGSGGKDGGDSSTGGIGGLTDGPVEAQVVIPYDKTKYPVTNLAATNDPPVIVATDDTSVYRTKKDATDATLIQQPIGGGAGTPLPQKLQRPQAMMTPPRSAFLYIAGGDATSNAGSVVRISKTLGTTDVVNTGSIELAVGIVPGSDGFGYVSLKAVASNTVSLMRFPLANTAPAQALFTATTPNESGGDIAIGSACVYWISNGIIYVAPTTGGDRKTATNKLVNDAVGITTDSADLFFTRGDGSVWKKPLSSSACDGAGPDEIPLAGGFPNIGDLIRYDTFVAWVATGDDTNSYAGGGVFKLPANGGDIVQIAPETNGPSQIDQSLSDIVFTTVIGGVHQVPKTPQ
jgi:hypothetical protein